MQDLNNVQIQENQSTPPQSNQKKKSKLFTILIFTLSLISLLGGLGLAAYLWGKGSKDTEENTESISNDTDDANLEEDMIYKEETAPRPKWIASSPESDTGPWNSGLYIATSEDGLTFTDEKLFLEHAGVANLIMTSDGTLIATFQYFSFLNEDMFNIIAYTLSSDSGKTWSSVKPVKVNDIGEGETKNGCDPTLVELPNGQLRLYFTHHQHGEEYPQLFSAIGDSIDSDFLCEGQQLSTEEIILDPAVVYFDGMWHHYTVKHGQSFESDPDSDKTSVHSISEDGLDFELVDDITLDMQFLGDVIEDDGGLRFYNGRQSAFSTDGYNWTLDDGERVNGADPGIVKLEDGSYIMIYTAHQGNNN